jgi:hypothetical protein
MKNEEIFQKIIEKAVQQGWKPKGFLKGLLDGKIGTGMEENFYKFILNSDDNSWYGYIFDLDFAKALWSTHSHNHEMPDTRVHHCDECGYDETMCHIYTTSTSCYEYHLRQLVVAEDKFEYLSKFVNE